MSTMRLVASKEHTVPFLVVPSYMILAEIHLIAAKESRNKMTALIFCLFGVWTVHQSKDLSIHSLH